MAITSSLLEIRFEGMSTEDELATLEKLCVNITNDIQEYSLLKDTVNEIHPTVLSEKQRNFLYHAIDGQLLTLSQVFDTLFYSIKKIRDEHNITQH